MTDDVQDGSSKTKTIEKSPLTLDKLPMDVLENVTCWLPLVDCLALRKVSRDLRSFVDSSKLHCETVDFFIGYGCARTRLDELELKYEDTKDGGCLVTWDRMDTRKTKTYRVERDFKQAMIADAVGFLEMPKLEIGVLELTGYGTLMWPEFMQFLKSLNFRLNVRSIGSRELQLLHSIQEFLNHEKLKEILYNEVNAVGFIRVAESNSEILQNPKLKLGRFNFFNYSDKAAAKFSKILESLNSQLHIQTVHVKNGRWIPTIFQCLNPEKVENFVIGPFNKLTVGELNEIAMMKQWKTKARLCLCIPEGIELKQLVDFKEIQTTFFNLIEENLITIRDILLKSPHLDSLELGNRIENEHFEDAMRDMKGKIERVMIEDTSYDASTRRFSIPNSPDYFQLKIGKSDENMMTLTVKRFPIIS